MIPWMKIIANSHVHTEAHQSSDIQLLVVGRLTPHSQVSTYSKSHKTSYILEKVARLGLLI